jgi:hypothetical protein
LVAGGNGSDDREAEAMSVLVVSAACVEALERLEEPVDFGARDDWTAVHYGQDGPAIAGVGGDVNLALGDELRLRVSEENLGGT